MPRSTAARRREVISVLSLGGPYEKLIPMQPSPMADTSRLLFPSLRFCISSPSKSEAVKRLLSHAVPRASERAEFLPTCETREQTNSRRCIPAGTRLHSTPGQNCSDTGRQAGDVLLLKRAGSWILRLANAAGSYES